MSGTDIYPLTRGHQQLVRVHLLQHVWHDTNGHLIHPVIGPPANKPLRVADVATASGLWLCEVSKSASNSDQYELHGFDISAQSFIAEDQLPQNVKLHVSDAKGIPPSNFVGQFDIVHVRLLQAVITDDDPTWVIKYCMQFLRPGGYLQWEEFDPGAATVHAQDEGGTALKSLFEQMHLRAPSRWVKSLPQHMTDMNMEVVTVERKREPAFHHSIITYLHCLVFEEYAHFLKGEAAEQLLAVTQAAYQESQRGAHIKYMFQTVVARKRED